MELHPHRTQYRALIITFFLAVCILVIGVIYNFQDSGRFGSNYSQNKTVRETPTPMPSANQDAIAKEPIFSIRLDNVTASIGDQVVTKVYGNSFGRMPVGFDVILQIEGVEYDVVAVRSVSKEFKTMNFSKPGKLTITGVLATSVNQATIWKDDALFEVILKPKSEGRMNLVIAESVGKESTKMVVETSEGQSSKVFSSQSESASVDIAK